MKKVFEDLTLEEQTAHITFLANRIAAAKKLGKLAAKNELIRASAFLRAIGGKKDHLLIAVECAESVP